MEKNHIIEKLNNFAWLAKFMTYKSTILTGFLIKACLLINIRDKNAKKIKIYFKSHIGGNAK